MQQYDATPTRRCALVTGGSSGIGRAVAETLARDGCDVGIMYLGNPEDAHPVINNIQSFGRRAWSCIVDVTDHEGTQGAANEFINDMGGIEILVNSAGIFRDSVIWKMAEADWRSVIDVDLTGVFNATQAVVPFMREHQYGSIINISSINGLRGKFGQTNYSAAKAGVIGFTKALAKELARSNITVNAIAPGMIDTPILNSMPNEALQRAVDEILVGRIGKPEDIAEAVAFLSSDRARFITGETLRVDGGQYM